MNLCLLLFDCLSSSFTLIRFLIWELYKWFRYVRSIYMIMWLLFTVIKQKLNCKVTLWPHRILMHLNELITKFNYCQCRFAYCRCWCLFAIVVFGFLFFAAFVIALLAFACLLFVSPTFLLLYAKYFSSLPCLAFSALACLWKPFLVFRSLLWL